MKKKVQTFFSISANLKTFKNLFHFFRFLETSKSVTKTRDYYSFLETRTQCL